MEPSPRGIRIVDTNHVKRHFEFPMAVCLTQMYEWLEQAVLMKKTGMPREAFILTFSAPPRTLRAIASLTPYSPCILILFHFLLEKGDMVSMFILDLRFFLAPKILATSNWPGTIDSVS